MDVHLSNGRVIRKPVSSPPHGYRITAVTFKHDDVEDLLKMDGEMLRLWLATVLMRFELGEVDRAD